MTNLTHAKILILAYTFDLNPTFQNKKYSEIFGSNKSKLV